MNPKIKKIIAREGLLLLGSVCIGLVIGAIFTKPHRISTTGEFDLQKTIIFVMLYVTIRFIIWAVRTLKK